MINSKYYAIMHCLLLVHEQTHFRALDKTNLYEFPISKSGKLMSCAHAIFGASNTEK